MKANSLRVITLLAISILLLSGLATAQGPQPPLPSYPPQGLGLPAEARLGTPEFGKPFIRPGVPSIGIQSAGTASIPLGQPGLSFRYVQTFGVTEEGYIEDTTHHYNPWGITTDGNFVWIAEMYGNRVVKFDNTGNYQGQIGKASFREATGTSLARLTDVAVDGDGNIWVVDADASHVVKFSPSGEILMEIGERWNAGSSNNQLDGPASVAFDTAGNIFISDGNNARIQIFDANGNYKTTLGITDQAGTDNNHFDGPEHIFIAGNRLYIADSGNHRIQIFNISSPYTPIWEATIGVSGEEGGDNNHLSSPTGVAVDASYIYVADSGNDRVQIFNRTTLAYVATVGSGSGSGDYQFRTPTDVAVDTAGNLYVADVYNNRVQQYNSGWQYVRTYGTTGFPYVTDGYHYNYPTGVAVASDGSIYIVEERGKRLVKLNANGTPQWTVGEPGVSGYDNSHFRYPEDVALDNTGRVYVADSANNRIQIYTSSGNYYATLGTGWGTGNYEFKSPHGLAVAQNGHLYVADRYNHRVQVYDANFVYVGTIGTTGVSGSDNSHFNEPYDVAVDSAGNVYVVDLSNHRVQKCVPGSGSWTCSTIIGETGVSGSDFGHLSNPIGITVDAAGRIYVADGWGWRVQVFDSTGAYLTTIGGSSGNHTGQMRQADGLAVDSAGNLYVAEYLNHRIQKFALGVPGWKQVNINGFGERRNLWISSLISFKGALYATGLQPYVWRMASDGTWSQVSTLGFGDSTNSEIDAMAVFNGHLYAATFTFVCDDPDCDTWHTNGPQFWRTADGTTWENVTPPGSIGSGYRWVPTMLSAGGYLYTALARGDQNSLGGEIWRTADGQNWQQVAAGGFKNDPYNTNVLSLAEYNGYLYAGTRHGDWQNDAHPDGPLGGEIWRYDGTTWTQVNNSGFGDLEAHRVEKLIVFNNALYAYVSHVVGTSKGAEIWRCTTTVCTSQSDWTKVMDNGFGNPQNQYIYGGAVFGSHLYAAVRNDSTGVQIYRTSDGTNWEPVSLDGLGDSNNGYVWTGAIVEHNNRLYIGTTNDANGGEVWKKTVTADFTASPTVGSPGTTVTFTNLSGGDVVTSTWNFGDGSPSLTVTHTDPVTHTYTTPGVYTVTLTVEDGVDTDVRTRTAYIQIAHRIFLPLVLRAYNPLIALYDDFNNPAFDGFYNPLKWRFWGDENYFSAQQQGGVLVITNTPSTPANVGLDLPIAMPLERTLSQVQRFQARMMVSSGSVGTGPHIHINSDNLGDHGWWAQCSLTVYGSQPGFDCDIHTYIGSTYTLEYGVSWPTPLSFDTWYTARIEIDPNTVQVCFYLDNNLLGCHVPNDAAALKTATNLVPRIGSWNGEAGATGTRYFDDVSITPAQ
jgi:sugar lactone lactonase YvrE/PKD repeat protein